MGEKGQITRVETVSQHHTDPWQDLVEVTRADAQGHRSSVVVQRGSPATENNPYANPAGQTRLGAAAHAITEAAKSAYEAATAPPTLEQIQAAQAQAYFEYPIHQSGQNATPLLARLANWFQRGQSTSTPTPQARPTAQTYQTPQTPSHPLQVRTPVERKVSQTDELRAPYHVSQIFGRLLHVPLSSLASHIAPWNNPSHPLFKKITSTEQAPYLDALKELTWARTVNAWNIVQVAQRKPQISSTDLSHVLVSLDPYSVSLDREKRGDLQQMAAHFDRICEAIRYNIVGHDKSDAMRESQAIIDGNHVTLQKEPELNDSLQQLRTNPPYRFALHLFRNYALGMTFPEDIPQMLQALRIEKERYRTGEQAQNPPIPSTPTTGTHVSIDQY